MADKINPDHYKDNPIETCDAIFSQLTEAESTLQEWEASPSSFSWFGDWISQNSGSLF